MDHFEKDRQEEILRLLGGCFNTQKTYGQDPKNIKGIAKVFIRILENYPLEAITKAFMWHLRSAVDFPTPADIVHIIDPKPIFDKPTYIAHKKWLENNKDAVWSLKERDAQAYCKAYEDSVMEEATGKTEWLGVEESSELMKKLNHIKKIN